jgi:hypothetical protein
VGAKGAAARWRRGGVSEVGLGDPLVCTPRDAVRSFYSSGIDTLFVGPFVLEK